MINLARWLVVFVSLVLALSFAGCAGKQAAQEAPVQTDAEVLSELAGRAWVAEYINGLPVIDISHTSMVFSMDGKVKGSGGCNSYSGGYTLKDREIIFTPMAATMRMCVPALSDQEMRFFQLLNGKLTVKFKNGLLYLVSEEGKPSIFAEHK